MLNLVAILLQSLDGFSISLTEPPFIYVPPGAPVHCAVFAGCLYVQEQDGSLGIPGLRGQPT